MKHLRRINYTYKNSYRQIALAITRPALCLIYRPENYLHLQFDLIRGCEPQVKGHITGNVNVGNDKLKLLAVATQLLPYIGYPRTLNAITCLNEVIPEK